MKNQNYYLGLDIGTDSVGYAVTNASYQLCKFGGEPMWGVTTFEKAGEAAKRRTFRVARRRLDRRKMRVLLLQELFAKEIAKIDENFFIRLRESGLIREDTSVVSPFVLFCDENYTDKQYHDEYPTIHHLIDKLMESDKPQDVRLVYLALAWLIAHRGHFLSEVDKDNIEGVLDFDQIYESLLCYFIDNGCNVPWDVDSKEAFANIQQQKIGITKKEKAFAELLFGGKKPKQDNYPYGRAALIKALSGGKVALKDLFQNDEYESLENTKLDLGSDDDTLAATIAELGEDGELILRLKAIYDWGILRNALGDWSCISKAKIDTYNTHKEDLKNLKIFVKKYAPDLYHEIFHLVLEKDVNYTAYSGHYLAKKQDIRPKSNGKEAFYDYLKKKLKDITPEVEDLSFYEDMMLRLQNGNFLPKQVDTDNRVLPYQLYYYELDKILTRTQKYLPFLSDNDEDGISVADKIRSIFLFRVPYYVGPLHRGGNNAWIRRKSTGRIYPWNFETKVDLAASEDAFIKRLIGVCTYLPGEKVLPKNSLLYCKFMVLNEINNLKINGLPISVPLKQSIFEDLYMKFPKVTRKNLVDYLKANGYLQQDDVLSGIDQTLKNALTSYHVFKRLLIDGRLTEVEVERIIERMAVSEDKHRLRTWLENEFANLPREDIAYLIRKRLKDFGRLSYAFLASLNGISKQTGEQASIITFLWETNHNVMELLSDNFTFTSEISARTKEYYAEHPQTLDERLSQMYVPAAVRRPIRRALEIVQEIKKANGADPKRVFIEMARGAAEDQKKKRTDARRAQIEAFYKNWQGEDISELSKQLDDCSDDQLREKKLFLYFMQLGKCMYTGQTIDIHDLKGEAYNIDHIYPQCHVKDDSLQNTILVTSESNGAKGDVYPIPAHIQAKMRGFWSSLQKNGLISDEKYKRLTRSTSFTEEERYGFINRQLVETRQATKAVATLLQEYLPDTEIVYVKAGLVSEFRQSFSFPKSRVINDLHHAKDAYLNIVVGNVYHQRFNKRWFSVDEHYNIQIKKLMAADKIRSIGGDTYWNGSGSLAIVRKVMQKNAVHFTRYQFCKKGGFFDQMPVAATKKAKLVPRKKGLDPVKYGGYNGTRASFFALVKY